jgi:hypothetical protein
MMEVKHGDELRGAEVSWRLVEKSLMWAFTTAATLQLNSRSHAVNVVDKVPVALPRLKSHTSSTIGAAAQINLTQDEWSRAMLAVPQMCDQVSPFHPTHGLYHKYQHFLDEYLRTNLQVNVKTSFSHQFTQNFNSNSPFREKIRLNS